MTKPPRVPRRRNPQAKALRSPSLRPRVVLNAKAWTKADRRRAKRDLKTRPEPRAEPR